MQKILFIIIIFPLLSFPGMSDNTGDQESTSFQIVAGTHETMPTVFIFTEADVTSPGHALEGSQYHIFTSIDVKVYKLKNHRIVEIPYLLKKRSASSTIFLAGNLSLPLIDAPKFISYQSLLI